jgi:orotate phosphoribosyltransferase
MHTEIETVRVPGEKQGYAVSRDTELRRQALKTLQDLEVLMRQGHFDYGNGFHGRVYLNPHQLFRHPSTIWRLAQDLLGILPGDLLARTEVVAGPATGGALLAHTLAGLLDGRRALTHPPCSFAPFTQGDDGFSLRGFYAKHMAGRRVILADDVRNTGKTFQRCAELVTAAGGIVIATVEICDRMEAVVDVGVPNYALAEYPAPENHPAAECPMCKAGEPITSF